MQSENAAVDIFRRAAKCSKNFHISSQKSGVRTSFFVAVELCGVWVDTNSPASYNVTGAIIRLIFHSPFAGYPQFLHSMKIKQAQLERLAASLLANYQAKDLLRAKGSEEQIKAKIMAVVSENFAAEEAIEDEARKLLAGHASATRGVDSYKMFLLAKQKLAAKKGFIL